MVKKIVKLSDRLRILFAAMVLRDDKSWIKELRIAIEDAKKTRGTEWY